MYEIITKLNNAKDKRLIALLLCIDLSDYFSYRTQFVRFNEAMSELRDIILGVP